MMSQAPVDALLLDVGGVLVNHENRLIYEAIAARCHPGVSARDVAARVVDPRIDDGTRSVSALRDELVDRLGYGGNGGQFLADWCCHFTFDPSMIAFAHALQRTTRVLLFSNTNREHWEFLVADPRNGLAAFERYLSFELGLAKPAVVAYERVAREAGIAPSRTLFFDDRMENVDGARRAGFHAELFTTQARLRVRLAEAGLHAP